MRAAYKYKEIIFNKKLTKKQRTQLYIFHIMTDERDIRDFFKLCNEKCYYSNKWHLVNERNKERQTDGQTERLKKHLTARHFHTCKRLK